MRHMNLRASKGYKPRTKRPPLNLRIQRRVRRRIERHRPRDLSSSNAQLKRRRAECPDRVLELLLLRCRGAVAGDDLDLRGIDGDVPQIGRLDDVVARLRRRARAHDGRVPDVRYRVARRLVEVEGEAVEQGAVVHGRGVVRTVYDARLRLQVDGERALALGHRESLQAGGRGRDLGAGVPRRSGGGARRVGPGGDADVEGEGVVG